LVVCNHSSINNIVIFYFVGKGKMPVLNDMLKDMPMHKNFYLRGVINSLLPEFMDPFDSEINETNVSGEALEALRLLINDKYPDLQEGQVGSIGYEDAQKFFKDVSIFEKNYEIESVGDQIRTSLGQFGIQKIDGRIKIFDIYDFEPRGGFDAAMESVNEARSVGDIYPIARYMGGVMMPEGGQDTLKVNITLPEQMQVVDMDYDDDIDPEAETFVFEGPMTNKRKTLWDAFTSMFVSQAKAGQVDDFVPLGLSPQQTKDFYENYTKQLTRDGKAVPAMSSAQIPLSDDTDTSFLDN